MADVERFRNGVKQMVKIPVASATVIEKGDFIVVSGGLATTPALLQAGGSKEATKVAAQSAIALLFVGVAETTSDAGETVDVVVNVGIEAQFEFAQTTAAGISFGARVEIDAVSTASLSWGCVDDTIVAGATNPIGVCVRAHSSSETGTLCKLVPQKIVNDVAGQS